MGGGGHAMDMNNRLRQMREERKSKGMGKFKRSYQFESKKRNIDLYRATPEEILSIRKKIILLEKERKLKLVLIYFTCILVIFLSWYYLKDVTLPPEV